MTAVAPAVGTRPATVDDSAVLREVFVTARPWLPSLSLPPVVLDALVDQQWRAQVAGYAATHPGARDLVLLLDDVPVGRLLVHDGPPVTVVDLAVLPAARGRGVATTALRGVLADAVRRSVDVRLTVTPGRPAERIYRRLGFVVTGAHGDDVVMTWRVAAGEATS